MIDISTRDTRTRFYQSKAWRRLRAKALARDRGLCVICERFKRIKPAREVDHIEPLRKRPDLALTLANLQSLCHTCHSRKTRGDERGHARICIRGNRVDACSSCTCGLAPKSRE